MNALEKLGEFVAARSRQHGEANLDRATNAFIDTLACNLAGIPEPVVDKVYRSIEQSSAGRVTAFGFGQTSAAGAALVNGTASHSQDFDDYNRSSVAHTSTVLIPTALAVSEQLDCRGATCLDASIIGLEVMVYLGTVINMDHYLRGWHATSTLGAIGAAAVASRLMRLDLKKSAAAMSLATSMIGGFKLQFGSMAKPLHAGLAAQSGINAALMAANGVSASTQVFDHEDGITSMWSDTDPGLFADTVLPESGQLAIEREGLYVKCYPCCGYSSRGIDGMIEIMQENNLDAQQIQKIEIEVPDRHLAVVRFHIPQNRLEARFSFPYCLSIAALYGSVTSKHFSDSMINNDSVRATMDRVVVNSYPADPDLDDLSADAPDRLRVYLKDGRVIDKTVRFSRGSPERPLSRSELFDKLWHCVEVDDEVKSLTESHFYQLATVSSVKPLIKTLASFHKNFKDRR